MGAIRPRERDRSRPLHGPHSLELLCPLVDLMKTQILIGFVFLILDWTCWLRIGCEAGRVLPRFLSFQESLQSPIKLSMHSLFVPKDLVHILGRRERAVSQEI